MVETKIALTLTRSLSALRISLIELTESTRLVALVVDLFGADTFDVANELHVPPYIFFPSSALVLSLVLHFPHLHETTTCEYRDLPEPIQLPGCVPLHGRDFMDPVQDRSNEAYKVMVRMCKKYRSAAGIMVNSFVDMEPGAFKAFKEQGQGLPPVHEAAGIVKIVWVPPEYGDAVACVCADGTLSLWEEAAEDAQPIQWKLCTSFKSGSAQLLDTQFGVSPSVGALVEKSVQHTMIIICPVYELLDPLDLKNWQLQAEFQNVIDSVSTFGKACA
ncbi:hypothetical protein L7F22_029089 [Adiantum nelumboides]|nr:hypothetical protein [Adiantum nelumboides]